MTCRDKVTQLDLGWGGADLIPAVEKNLADVKNFPKGLHLRTKKHFHRFIQALSDFAKDNPEKMKDTLSNILTTREIGNKTHGDMAEIGINYFINKYLPESYTSEHVGKINFRAKELEEDIEITDMTEKDNPIKIPVSIKTYGNGPLQLSTDKESRMFPRLETEQISSGEINDSSVIKNIFEDVSFQSFTDMNVLPLIYDENAKRCNIMLFDFAKARKNTKIIRFEEPDPNGKRKHPAFKFFDQNNDYICEVRYGDAAANALQRGLWTNTALAANYFISVTNGWIEYETRQSLLDVMPILMTSTADELAQILRFVKKNKDRN